ncbi:MAG TPA: hypothetical protein VFB41_01605 [Solirubrobacteraceae bacterium]|nr:hypothetical protein [Solirubrobacteraceae bacterium]
MASEERHHKGLAVAGACVVLGFAIIGLALFALPRDGSDAASPPPTQPATAVAGNTGSATTKSKAKSNAKSGERKVSAHTAAADSADALARARVAWEQAFARNDVAHVPAGWVSGYYDLYGRAQRTFGVNWLLLASIHRQETAFSTAASTYHGLNFAHCCAGPMQFNVTNGPTTTWERYRAAYRLADRPDDYPHKTERHPSVYDDYDAMMAAASLLRSSGAAAALDVSAWQAAYDYYGHDEVGVEYADQVVARAIGWSQTGFSINQGIDPKLIEAVHLAWGEPVLKQFAAADRKARKEAAAKRKQANADDDETSTTTTTETSAGSSTETSTATTPAE